MVPDVWLRPLLLETASAIVIIIVFVGCLPWVWVLTVIDSAPPTLLVVIPSLYL